MARLSQSLLSNLGKPAYQESMFGLGQAIGGLGSQRREQQVRKKEEGMLQGLAPGSVEYNEQLMNIYQSRGELEKAAAMGLKVEEQRNLEEEKQKATRQKTASSQALITDIQGILSQLEGKKDPKSKQQKQRALTLLRNSAVAGEDAEASFRSSVELLRKDVEGEKLGLKGTADLAKTFLSESVETYLETGNPKDLDIRPPVAGSKAAPKEVTLYDEKTKRNQVWGYWREADGTVKKELLGFSEVKEEDPVDLGLGTPWGSKLLSEAREKATNSKNNALTFRELSNEASERGPLERGTIGEAISVVEQSLGIAGDETARRKRIEEIRVSGVLDLLPPGPASDKDVEIAMRAILNPNNLSNEEAASYLRGLALIEEATAKYYSAKSDFIQYTRDPNAVGFENWVSKTAAENKIESIKQEAPSSVQKVLQKIEAAKQLSPQEQEKALEELKNGFPEIVSAIENLAASNKRWDSTVQRNPSLKDMF
jgi:hypothetical protein